jgi:hypothetical protein
MTNQIKCSPTPWKLIDRKSEEYDSHSYSIICGEPPEDLEDLNRYKQDLLIMDNHPYYNTAPSLADAKLIVRCVNERDELVEFVKEFAESNVGDADYFATRKKAQALLTKISMEE